MIVGRNQDFLVAHHDFTRFSLVPSVTLIADIPKDITGSWYSGNVIVNLKESSMEPSSPIRHVSKLVSNLQDQYGELRPVLFLYTDGGPDHRITYLSVQLSLILVFLACDRDLDFLVVARTAPCQSWANPVERIMSVLNLGLQSVGLMRTSIGDETESLISNCKNLQQIRAAAARTPLLTDAIADSIEPVKVLLSSVFQRLHLKGEQVRMASAATEAHMKELMQELVSIDEPFQLNEKIRKAILKQRPKLVAYMEHCCQLRQYSFSIKKCGNKECQMCRPIHLPPDVFAAIHHLPDPVPGEKGHYKPFHEVYGYPTTEDHRPSLAKRAKKQKTLPFIASVQHVRNVSVMVQCEQCGMWHHPKSCLHWCAKGLRKSS